MATDASRIVRERRNFRMIGWMRTILRMKSNDFIALLCDEDSMAESLFVVMLTMDDDFP